MLVGPGGLPVTKPRQAPPPLDPEEQPPATANQSELAAFQSPNFFLGTPTHEPLQDKALTRKRGREKTRPKTFIMDVDLSVPAPPGYDPTKSLEDQQQQQQPVNAQNGAGGAGTGTTSAIKRRAAIACRRCVSFLFSLRPKASLQRRLLAFSLVTDSRLLKMHAGVVECEANASMIRANHHVRHALTQASA